MNFQIYLIITVKSIAHSLKRPRMAQILLEHRIKGIDVPGILIYLLILKFKLERIFS